MLRAVDFLFLIGHSVLIGFNLFGWAFRKTRRIHLVVISLTIASWFGLGALFGWGYCPITDWHWDVKRSLGESGLPNSWVKYYVDLLTGQNWNVRTVDTLVAVLGLGALVLSILMNVRDHVWSTRFRAT